MENTFKVQHTPSGSSPESLLPGDWSIVDVPVPGLRIVLGFKCSQCGWLQGSRESLEHHYSKQHNKKQQHDPTIPGTNPPSKYGHSRVLMQACFNSSTLMPRLFPANCGKWYLQVLQPLETQNNPQNQILHTTTQFSSNSTPITPSALVPSYISALGWIEWLQGIELSEDLFKLRWLVSTPQNQQNSGDEILDRVEHGLWKTSQLLKDYLQDAEEMLDSKVAGVRDAICGK